LIKGSYLRKERKKEREKERKKKAKLTTLKLAMIQAMKA
jgi:hypothetical protein